MGSIAHSYGNLASEYGINVVHDWAVDIDRGGKTVSLAGGGTLNYDRLVLSPGIDFVDGAVEGHCRSCFVLFAAHRHEGKVSEMCALLVFILD